MPFTKEEPQLIEAATDPERSYTYTVTTPDGAQDFTDKAVAWAEYTRDRGAGLSRRPVLTRSDGAEWSPPSNPTRCDPEMPGALRYIRFYNSW